MEITMAVAGIDYSLTSPALCIHEGETWSYSNCKFYYLVKNDKLAQKTKQYIGEEYPHWNHDVQRFTNLANWSVGHLSRSNVTRVALEGYAFGAVGRVFQIAENAGILKLKLWETGLTVLTPAPTEIKKFATGKGNANEERMVEAFEEECGVDIRDELGIKTKTWNPISDVVDAYYICKFGFEYRNDL